MDSNSPRIRSLLRQAQRTETAGKRAAAEDLYRGILSEEPNTLDAWLGLARVIRDPDKEEEAYRQALKLDPDSREAQLGISGPTGIDAGEVKNPEIDTTAEKVEGEAAAAGGDVDTYLDRASELTDNNKPSSGSGLMTAHDEIVDAGDSSVDVHIHEEIESTEVLFCANHPNRKTHLRCNRCGKPICSSCARPTPVGYRCPECIREHEDIYFTATIGDYLVAALISFPLAFIVGLLASRIGFFAIFLAAVVGSFLGRIVFRAAGRRRGRWLPHLVATAIVIGGALPLILNVLTGNLFGALFMGIYIVTASGAAYYQMR